MITSSATKNKINSKEELKEVFLKGIKPKSEFKIGVEIEKLPVKKKLFRAVSYYEKNGIKDFLEEFSIQENWEQVKQNGHLLALKKDGNNITLEPGSQFEISLSPNKNIHGCAKYLESYHKKTGELANQMGFIWLGYGIQPVSTYPNIDVIPKDRYELMGKYLPQKASEPLVMMRETAGIQVALDYSSEEDAISKLRLGLMMSPFISAMFSNSPIRAEIKTAYQSYRAHSWLNTDPDRCGFISKKLFDKNYEFSFDDYIDTLMKTPMIFVERNGTPIEVKNMTFNDYFENGYSGLEATKEDWELHSSLFFPDVRMKNFIEFRNTDCQNQQLSLAIMAIYKGAFYNKEAISRISNLLQNIDWETLNTLRNLTPKYGLKTEINGIKVFDICKEIIEISKNSLIEQGENEEVYLESLKNYTLKGKTPSDILIDICGSNIRKLVEFTQIL